MTEQQMNSNPTYQQPSCTPCAACNESNTTTTRQRDVNETKTIADDTARRVPQFRFPEFQNAGEWESASFTDLFSLLPNNTLSRAELSTDGEGIYNIHYGDILIKFPSYVNVQKTTLPCIKEATKISNISKARLKDGDIVIADTAEDETAGKCIEIGNVKNTAVVAGLHTIPCRPNKRFAPAYLGYYMNSHAFHSMLLPIMQGAKVTSISRTALKSVIIYYPSSIEEQQKIADCLLTIDDHIVAITQKLEQLKIQKKALLQKLFPQRGKSMPELRFSEFTGEWEEVKLGDIIIVHSGRDYKHLNHGNVPVYGTGGYMLSVDDYLSEIDAVGIGRKGTIDKPQYLKGPFWTVDTLFYMTANEGYDVKFIYYLSQTIAWKKYGEQTGVPSLSKVSIENMEIYVSTNIAEQRKIADAFSSLDDSIDSCSKKISELLQHKKGLMQKLFPLNI